MMKGEGDMVKSNAKEPWRGLQEELELQLEMEMSLHSESSKKPSSEPTPVTIDLEKETQTPATAPKPIASEVQIIEAKPTDGAVQAPKKTFKRPTRKSERHLDNTRSLLMPANLK